MSASTYKVAFLECDGPQCGATFECGEDSIEKTRNEAEGCGTWLCDRQTDTDLCERHMPKESDEAAPGAGGGKEGER